SPPVAAGLRCPSREAQNRADRRCAPAREQSPAAREAPAPTAVEGRLPPAHPEQSTAVSRAPEQLLRDPSELVGCAEVARRRLPPRLEVVYAELQGGRVVISDRGETFRYLSRRDDSTFDVELLDDEMVRGICAAHGVELEASDPELFPRVQRHVGDE